MYFLCILYSVEYRAYIIGALIFIFAQRKNLDIKKWGFSSDWFVEFVRVKVKNHEYYFPCYEWVEDGYVAFPGWPLNEEPGVLKKHRTEFLAVRYKQYQWIEKNKIAGGLTGHLPETDLRKLDRNDRFSQCFDKYGISRIRIRFP